MSDPHRHRPAISPQRRRERRGRETAQFSDSTSGSRISQRPLRLSDEPELTPPSIWRSAAEVEAAFDQRLAAAESIRQQLLAVPGKRTLENTLQPYNDILIAVDRVLPMGDLMANVHPDAGVRGAAEKGVQRARKFLNDLRLEPRLYQAVSDVADDGLDTESRRFRFLLLRDYRRAGVDKDEGARQKLSTLYQGMVSAGQEFSRNIREDKRFIELDSSEDLAGLPPDFIAAHLPGRDGKIRITTDYSDSLPFMTYARREDLRRALYFKFDQRGYPQNEKPLKELLTLRHQYAAILGYRNWADYSAEDKMVKKEEVIAGFLEQVAATARPRMKQDLARLLARKKLDNPGAGAIHEWDRAYYGQKVRSEQFGVDSQEVRSYLEFNRVKEGILELAQELFGITFKKVANADVWHPSVEAYDVFDGRPPPCANCHSPKPVPAQAGSGNPGSSAVVHSTPPQVGAPPVDYFPGAEPIGRFYLDLHPRQDKYSHMAVFHMKTGLLSRQPAVIALVGNFNGPGAAAAPALLEHGEVLTFLHEFGHLTHHLLASKHAWVTISGFSTEWDFVETPSQLLEEWGWDAGFLSRFARHHRTGQPMPPELIEKMHRAEEFGKGLDIMRQVFYARLSLTYHHRDPKDLDLLAVLKEIKKEYSPYPYEENTHTYTSFGHLDEYSSMYYTYLWSRALEKDIFTIFETSGLMDKKTALAYRRTVLEPGGAVDAADMLRDFLGRDYSFDAFRKWLQEP